MLFCQWTFCLIQIHFGAVGNDGPFPTSLFGVLGHDQISEIFGCSQFGSWMEQNQDLALEEW